MTLTERPGDATGIRLIAEHLRNPRRQYQRSDGYRDRSMTATHRNMEIDEAKDEAVVQDILHDVGLLELRLGDLHQGRGDALHSEL